MSKLHKTAQFLAGSLGVRVIFDSSTPYIDLENMVIHLPDEATRKHILMLPDDYNIIGDLHHEVGHVVVDLAVGTIAEQRQLDSSVAILNEILENRNVKNPELLKSVYNSLTDPRMERIYCEYYRGAKKHLDINNVLTYRWWNTKWSLTEDPLTKMLKMLSFTLRDSLPELPKEGEKFLAGKETDNFISSFGKETWQFILDVKKSFDTRSNNTRDFMELVYEIYLIVLQNYPPNYQNNTAQLTYQLSGELTDTLTVQSEKKENGIEDINSTGMGTEDSDPLSGKYHLDTDKQLELDKIQYSIENADGKIKRSRSAQKLINSLIGNKFDYSLTPELQQYLEVTTVEIDSNTEDEELEKKGQQVAYKLMQYLQARKATYELPNQEEGFLDLQDLPKMILKTGDDFFYEEITAPYIDERDVCVSIVADTSGSMRGRDIRLLRMSSYVIGSAMNYLDIPLQLITFSNKTTRWKNFGESWFSVRGRIGYMEASGGTLMYPALKEARETMLLMPQTRKLIFCLTDGSVTDHEICNTTLANMIDLGFEIIPYNYGKKKNFVFNDYIEINDLWQLNTDLIDRLSTYLRSGKIFI